VVSPNDGYTTSYTCLQSDVLTVATANLLMTQTIPQATAFVQSFLKVQNPVAGNLTFPGVVPPLFCNQAPLPSQYLTAQGTQNVDYIMLWTARPVSQGE
jgi:hypothetical protein